MNAPGPERGGELPVLIVGAGIAGLSAAWELQGRGVPYLLLDEKNRVGGKIHTEYPQGYLIEEVADAFILQKPHAARLAAELGLQAETVHPREDTRHLYFLKRGELLPFTNMRLFVPLDDATFLQSRLLSPAGLRRFLAEQDLPPSPPEGDESLASFVIRRFGEEALDLVVPLMAGIYMARAEELSMRATFPQFLAFEAKDGSVIRGMRRVTAVSTGGPVFMSFRGGMRTLTEALRGQLTGELRLGARALAADANSVTLHGGEVLRGRGVVLATPAWRGRELLQRTLPGVAARLAEFRANGSVAVVLAYPQARVHGDLNMHGVLVDAREDTPLKAITLHSSKLPGRAPEGGVLLRAFFGNIEPEAAERHARAEAERLLGARGEPLLTRVLDWRGQNPAYDLGHLERVSELNASLPPGLRLVGASFGGVGIPDCVRYAREQVGSLAEALAGALAPLH